MTPCLPPPGRPHATGYGRVTVDGKQEYAHRVAWERAHGPIPAGLQVDHLCRNRFCWRVDHLELVTAAENKRRGDSPAARAARTDLCPSGHRKDTVKADGSRRCSTCHREQERARVARKRAVA